MRKEAQKETEDLREKPNHVFKLVKLMKRDGKDTIGGRCLKGKDGSLVSRNKIGKSYERNTWRGL